MNFMTTLNETNSITRRAALGGGIAYGLACLSSRRMLAATILPITSVGSYPSEADLYAFPGANTGTTVIALTTREDESRSEIRIHTGSRDWVFENHCSKSYGFPAFRGKVLTGPTGRTQVRDAVVIEIPNGALAGMESTGIWAEQFSESGERRRIGSPFIAAVLMNNAGLARDYHSISPSQDREVLLEGVAEAFAAGARNTPQIGDPLGYGRRLASWLLPDVLHYNPKLPQGFSFAGRNGRHPGEDSAAVVATMLNGSPVAGATTASWRVGNAFPYFPRPIALA